MTSKPKWGRVASYYNYYYYHQGSVRTPLLFAIVLDVVTKEARAGLPFELLYAEDLVLIAPTLAELKRKIYAWKINLASKGLKVTPQKTKILVSDGAIINEPKQKAKWPCGVCGKGVGANSIRYLSCMKWIHRKM